MKKISFNMRFRTFIICTVALIVALLFVTIKAVQAQSAVVEDDDLTRPSDAISQSTSEHETISTDSTDQRILDGDNTDPDAGDTLVIEAGGEIWTDINDEEAVIVTGDKNKVTNRGKIKTTEVISFGILLYQSHYNEIINEVDAWIETTEDYSLGLYLYKSHYNFITNYGTIKTSGYRANGIHVLESHNNKVDNYGTIEATGEIADGIHLYVSHNNFITNYGTITADRDGISSKGDGNLITNEDDGTITAGNSGMYSQGEDNTITNNGSITAGGDGIFITTDTLAELKDQDAESGRNTIINNGSIDAGGDGIAVIGNNAKIFNRGLIDAKRHGIHSEGDNVTITNEDGGIISTTSYSANGIYSDGNYVTITNNSSIETAFNLSNAIESRGDYNTITNGVGGTILTTGDWSYGIKSVWDNNTINNYGSITTMGYDSHGIWLLGADNTIANFGSIKTEGIDAHGILIQSFDGQTNQIDNFGTITVTDPSAYAIKGGAGKETLNLFDGTRITGDIDLGLGDDIINAYCDSIVNGDIQFGAGDDMMTVHTGATFNGAIDFDEGIDTLKVYDGNHALTFEDVEGGTAGNAAPENIETDESLLCIVTVPPGEEEEEGGELPVVVVIIDKTEQVVKSAALSDLTSGLHGVLRKRLNHIKPEYIKLASTRIESGMLTKPKQPKMWGDMFHSYRKRDDDGRVAAYDNRYSGFTGGFERYFERVRLGVLGGYANAVTESDNKTFETKSYSYFTGVYGQYDFTRFKLRASLIGGYEDHNNERYVTDNMFGAETARADFGSIFLSPSITLLTEFNIAKRLKLRPSATVKYSAGWYDDYQEHGTTRANIEMDSRVIQTLNPEVQLGIVYQITKWCEFELSAGGMARYTDDGSIDGKIGSSDFRIAESGDDNVYGAQVGAYLGADVTDKLQLYVNAQFSDATGGETQDIFMAGLEFRF